MAHTPFDYEAAKRAFDQALELALSDAPLDEEWSHRFEALSHQRTYVAILATPLLSRAVDPTIDAAVLLVRNGGEGYSARRVFTHVIFEKCQTRGVPLLSTGREPHNNSPFVGNARIQTILRPRVKAGNQADFDYLVESLEAANKLSQADSLKAFAAFLRNRVLTGALPSLELQERAYNLEQIRAKLDTFVFEGSEGGRRGEALVAACLDLLFPNVHLNAKINDPSRHWPGDVIALAPGATIRTENPDDVLLSAEVKERMPTQGEILQFVDNLAKAGVRQGLYAPLPRAASASINAPDLEAEALRRKVSLTIPLGIDALITSALVFTHLPPTAAITTFVKQLGVRLKEKEAIIGLKEWIDFAKELPSAAPMGQQKLF